ncbi:MAG: transcriptional repressor [Alphaproteobacteria bacterium]|nr:transcriptional repressor [Alphaproteobacteria bacterium]
MSAQDLEQKCIDAGLKMTTPRRVILNVLAHAHDHPSVEEVYERSKKKDPSISMATVYRTLGLLDELGLVFRHEFSDADYARYEVNEEHHHHLIDIDSGKVLEFQNDEIEKMKQKIAANLGYELVECRLELYGRKLKK